MKKYLLVIGTAVGILGLSAFKPFKSESEETDKIFAQKVALDERFIAEISKLARTHALRIPIIDLGDVMYTAGNTYKTQINAQAQANGLELTSDLTPEQVEAYEGLEKMSGDQFDKEYTRLLLKTNREIYAAFKRECKNGIHLKEWAYKKMFAVNDLVHVSKVCYYIARHQ